MTIAPQSIPVRVADITAITPLVRRFRFAPLGPDPLPPFSGGAHVVVELRDGERVRRNPYSLTGAPGAPDHYEISVRRVDEGRGGSVFLHERVRVGDVLAVSPPVNLFALAWNARKHLLIAGGIGITPFMSQTVQLDAGGMPFELHYCIRGDDRGPYWRTLLERWGERRVRVHRADDGLGFDLDALLARQPLGTHLFVCGPGPMIDLVLDTARAAGWPDENLHSERFLAPQPGAPFDVELVRSGLRVHVPSDRSLLEAIEAAGVTAPYLCRGGACGHCETRVSACDGTLIHRDHWLSDADHAAGHKVMPCVSRFEGRHLALDL